MTSWRSAVRVSYTPFFFEVAIHTIRRTAAEILAAAVYEMFPLVELLGGGETSSGFYYDFVFPHSIHPELHLQMEERMKLVVREKREIRNLEMMAAVAKEFLKSKGHFSRASHIEGSGLFSLIQMGSFVDLSQGACLDNTNEIRFFKIFPPKIIQEKTIRVFGVVFDTKEALKESLKQRNVYSRKRHEAVGEARGFWASTEEGFVLLSPFFRQMSQVVETFKNHFDPIPLEIRPLHDANRKNILENLNAGALFEICPIEEDLSSVEEAGWFEPIEGSMIQITTSLKNIISSLQSIGKTLNILGFSYTTALVGSRRGDKGYKLLESALKEISIPFIVESEGKERGAHVDFLVSDALGRQWSAVTVSAQECLNVQVIVERNVALLLEL